MDFQVYDIMEKMYQKHSASNNAAQLMMRYEILESMLKIYSPTQIVEMLYTNFDEYHSIAKNILKRKYYIREV